MLYPLRRSPATTSRPGYTSLLRRYRLLSARRYHRHARRRQLVTGAVDGYLRRRLRATGVGICRSGRPPAEHGHDLFVHLSSQDHLNDLMVSSSATKAVHELRLLVHLHHLGDLSFHARSQGILAEQSRSYRSPSEFRVTMAAPPKLTTNVLPTNVPCRVPLSAPLP